MNILEKAENYARKWHTETNHKYDGENYDEAHLAKVVKIGEDFINLVHEDERDNVLAGCWLHDSIEDARISYNTIKKELNETIAELAYALTNEKGKTRQERANDKYYEGIRNTRYATFIKVCDRIANVEYSKQSGSSMFEKYKKENKNFVSKIYTEEFKSMFAYLNSLFE